MKFRHLYLPTCTIFWILNNLHFSSCNVFVSTQSGIVSGYSLDFKGLNIVGSRVTSLSIFLGIPYAEPPIGNLRFARPVPKKPWSPLRLNALKHSPACPQPIWFLRKYSLGPTFNNTDENCLYLNIYSPQNFADPNATYPVLVWIHGGSYKYGSGAEFDGRILAQEGVVVVTINYRLGVLGFLSTDDSVAPGNYGVLDQLLAIKWIKDNVVNFNGDPNRITIMGQSAGGGSVSLHMFSPLAKGLFNSVIAQSGCALSPWSIYRPPHKIGTYTQSLALSIGCTTSSSSDLIACLRSKDVNLLIDAYIRGPPMISTFAPRIDGYYIYDLPEVLLARGDYHHHVHVLNGYLPNEVSEDFESEPGIDNGLSTNHLEQLFHSKSRRYLANADDIYTALKCAYPPNNSDKMLNRELLINMNSDYGYVAPHIKLTQELSANGDSVWLYEFTYRSANSRKKPWIGVPHAEELYYQFGAPFFDVTPCPSPRNVSCPVTWGKYQNWSSADKSVSLQMMKLWANFARIKQNYTAFSINEASSLSWQQYLPNETMLNISATITQEHLLKSSGIRFWDSFNYLNLTERVSDVCRSESSILVGK